MLLNTKKSSSNIGSIEDVEEDNNKINQKYIDSRNSVEELTDYVNERIDTIRKDLLTDFNELTGKIQPLHGCNPNELTEIMENSIIEIPSKKKVNKKSEVTNKKLDSKLNDNKHIETVDEIKDNISKSHKVNNNFIKNQKNRTESMPQKSTIYKNDVFDEDYKTAVNLPLSNSIKKSNNIKKSVKKGNKENKIEEIKKQLRNEIDNEVVIRFGTGKDINNNDNYNSRKSKNVKIDEYNNNDNNHNNHEQSKTHKKTKIKINNNNDYDNNHNSNNNKSRVHSKNKERKNSKHLTSPILLSSSSSSMTISVSDDSSLSISSSTITPISDLCSIDSIPEKQYKTVTSKSSKNNNNTTSKSKGGQDYLENKNQEVPLETPFMRDIKSEESRLPITPSTPYSSNNMKDQTKKNTTSKITSLFSKISKGLPCSKSKSKDEKTKKSIENKDKEAEINSINQHEPESEPESKYENLEENDVQRNKNENKDKSLIPETPLTPSTYNKTKKKEKNINKKRNENENKDISSFHNQADSYQSILESNENENLSDDDIIMTKSSRISLSTSHLSTATSLSTSKHESNERNDNSQYETETETITRSRLNSEIGSDTEREIVVQSNSKSYTGLDSEIVTLSQTNSSSELVTETGTITQSNSSSVSDTVTEAITELEMGTEEAFSELSNTINNETDKDSKITISMKSNSSSILTSSNKSNNGENITESNEESLSEYNETYTKTKDDESLTESEFQSQISSRSSSRSITEVKEVSSNNKYKSTGRSEKKLRVRTNIKNKKDFETEESEINSFDESSENHSQNISKNKSEFKNNSMFVKKTIPKSGDEVERLKYSNKDNDDNWDSDTIDSILNSSRSINKKKPQSEIRRKEENASFEITDFSISDVSVSSFK